MKRRVTRTIAGNRPAGGHDTWFWLDNAPKTLTVHATGGGNEATVTAMFAGMEITAPGEAHLSRTGPGTRTPVAPGPRLAPWR